MNNSLLTWVNQKAKKEMFAIALWEKIWKYLENYVDEGINYSLEGKTNRATFKAILPFDWKWDSIISFFIFKSVYLHFHNMCISLKLSYFSSCRS